LRLAEDVLTRHPQKKPSTHSPKPPLPHTLGTLEPYKKRERWGFRFPVRYTLSGDPVIRYWAFLSGTVGVLPLSLEIFPLLFERCRTNERLSVVRFLPQAASFPGQTFNFVMPDAYSPSPLYISSFLGSGEKICSFSQRFIRSFARDAYFGGLRV